MAKVIKHIVFYLLLAALPMVPCTADVEPNLVLAGQIMIAKNKFETALQNQRNRQLMVAEGHVFLGREVQAVNELQREFNDYLDQFHDAISTAAELYGTFLEIKRTVKLSQQVTDIISDAPTNAIAVLLKPNTSGLYGTVLQTSLDAAQDIYNACISKKKMTAQDRNKMLTDARKKIKKVNSDLTKLVVVLKYTSFEDIWSSIRTRAKYMDRERKHAIIERCFDNWKNNMR
jgi:hypothetical protein